MFIKALPLVALLSAAPALAASVEPQLGTCLDAAKHWCLEPAAAAGWQLNLKTGEMKNLATMLGYALVHEVGFPVGVGLYGGVGFSADSPNALQGNLLFSVSNFGAVGLGLEGFRGKNGGMVYQALLTLAFNLNSGGTVSYLREAHP